MFEVGDEVTVTMDFPITKVGDIGTIYKKTSYGYDVRFHTMENENFLGHPFSFGESQLELVSKGSTMVERKIKRMYARQFRKTGYGFFQ